MFFEISRAELLETGVGEGRVEVDNVGGGVDLDGGEGSGGEVALAGGMRTGEGSGIVVWTAETKRSERSQVIQRQRPAQS